MEELASLLVLCMIMFTLTISVGYLPMFVELSSKILESISVFGAGFLLGTALIVIIPEGLSILMEYNGILEANHNHINVSDHIQFQNIQHDSATRQMLTIDIEPDFKLEHNHEHHHTHDPIVHSIFRTTGCIVCFGFVFMIFVERLVSEHSNGHGHDHDHAHKKPPQVQHHDEGAVSSQPPESTKPVQSNLWSFMIGLLTHSAIDGIALGAVSVQGEGEALTLLVFLALMAHKGPAAISLTAFLKRKAHALRDIRYKLCLFSLAAPVFALVTFCVLSSYNYIAISPGTSLQENLEETLTDGAIEDDFHDHQPSQLLAWCLLFSGGTFLYVVTLHIIPEIKQWRQDAKHMLTWFDLALFSVGCVMPSLVQHTH